MEILPQCGILTYHDHATKGNVLSLLLLSHINFIQVESISLNHCWNSNNIHAIRKSNEMDLKNLKEGNTIAPVKKK